MYELSNSGEQFLELATNLNYFRANWLLEKKDNFMPCNREKPSGAKMF